MIRAPSPARFAKARACGWKIDGMPVAEQLKVNLMLLGDWQCDNRSR
jgi:hypothetical protein